MPVFNSFYGGRRGASFVLKKSYPTIPAMTSAFANPNNPDVGFDEYAIIDNQNRNHPDNGKVFRRGYNYGSEQGIAYWDEKNPTAASTAKSHGAILVGKISGPAGRAPNVKLVPMSSVTAAANNHAGSVPHSVLVPVSSGQITMIPGKIPMSENKYNDNIKFKSVTVRTDRQDDSTVYAGFEVPYSVIDFAASSASAYSNPTITPSTSAYSSATGLWNHPFYNKWNLTVPKGIKGDTLGNLQIITWANRPSGINSLYDPTTGNIININTTDKFTETEEILIYKVTNYNSSASGSSKYYFLGKYRDVTNVNLSNDGTLSFSFSAGGGTTFQNKIKWITGVALNSNQQLIVSYNTGAPSTLNLPYVSSMSYDNNTISYRTAGSSTSTSLITLKYVNDISQDGTGKITLTYNDGETKEIPIKDIERIGWVTTNDISTSGNKLKNEDIDKLFVKYKDGTINLLSESPFYVIDQFNFDDKKGQLTIKKSNETDPKVYSFSYPTSINYNMQNGALEYTLLGKDEPQPIGKLPLIKQISVGTNKFLYIKYNLKGSDQATINAVKQYELSQITDKNNNDYYDSQHPSYRTSPNDFWVNVGHVQSTTAPLIARNFTYTQIKEQISSYPIPDSDPYRDSYQSFNEQTDFEDLVMIISNALSYLYSGGMNGQVVTVGEGDTSRKDFYAYGAIDETNNTARWYYLGRIEDSRITIGENADTSGDGILLKTSNDVCSITYDIPSSIGYLHKITQIKKGSRYKNIFSSSLQSYSAAYGFRKNSTSEPSTWTSFLLNTEISPVVKKDMVIKIETT